MNQEIGREDVKTIIERELKRKEYEKSMQKGIQEGGVFKGEAQFTLSESKKDMLKRMIAEELKNAQNEGFFDKLFGGGGDKEWQAAIKQIEQEIPNQKKKERDEDRLGRLNAG